MKKNRGLRKKLDKNGSADFRPGSIGPELVYTFFSSLY